MKQGKICKTAGDSITPEQLERIHQYTRRALAPEELFVFSIILCDNEIDRDYERFDDQTLEELARLFVGTTGVFDHVAVAENQSARIFDTTVTTSEEHNSLGQPYKSLKAWAYMVRCAKNETLILEIDAGIKKEVSVGCAVKKISCSLCGANQKEEPCGHKKGQHYDSVLCHSILSSATDAYEWSFVAVPAQKKAGVTKRYPNGSQDPDQGTDVLAKITKAHKEILLTKEDVYYLQEQIASLQGLAEQGQAYVDTLQKEVVRYASLAQFGVSAEVLENVVRKLSLPELTAFHASYKQAAEVHLTPIPQLAPKPQGTSTDTSFKI